MNYIFKYKKDKSLLWKKEVVKGHGFDYDKNGKWTGSMVLYFPNGSIKVIPNWNQYKLILNTDWLIACKKQAEKEGNTKVNLEVENGN
jgi:hypothetical protein